MNPAVSINLSPVAVNDVARAARAGAALRHRVIALTLLCALPAAGLLGLGRLTLAAYSFWGTLILVTGLLLLSGRVDTVLGLVLSVVPLMNLLRGVGLVPYTTPLLMLIGVLVWYGARSGRIMREVWRRWQLVPWMFALATVYYLATVIATHDYARNLRLFEMCLAGLAILLAGRHRDLLGSGLTGLILSACLLGIAMIPHHASVGRLGMIVVEDTPLGNPVQLGMALALGFLALTTDHGRWLRLPEFWRWVLVLPTAALLLMTTSRLAWLVAVSGFIAAALFGRGQRLWLLVMGGVAALVFFSVLISPVGPMVQTGLDRTFGDERSIRSRTSGRSDQWRVSAHAMTRSPERLLFGYGPGQGPAVYARYSSELDGITYSVGRPAALHSLLMQLMVETGLVGLCVWLAWIVVALVKVLRWAVRTDRMLPLVCLGAYLCVILTVSGSDTGAGAALGIALLATRKQT